MVSAAVVVVVRKLDRLGDEFVPGTIAGRFHADNRSTSPKALNFPRESQREDRPNDNNRGPDDDVE